MSYSQWVLLRVVQEFNNFVEKNSRLAKIPKEYRRVVERDMVYIADRIREKRQKLNLTQEELAEKTNLATKTIQAIEQNRRTASLEALLLIAHVLRLRLDLN